MKRKLIILALGFLFLALSVSILQAALYNDAEHAKKWDKWAKMEK